MNKKLIILLLALIFTCGCSNIKESSIDNLVSEIQNSNFNVTNNYRNGYKYYLPSNMKIEKSLNANEVLKYNDIKYYLYVDLISYYNKAEKNYKINTDSFYSKDISKDDIKGYIEINVKNDKYLIEIMYNYAKIEVIVDDCNINETVVNSLVLLSSIKYNNDIIKNLLEEDILNYSEETFSIFDEKSNESNFLDVVQEYDNYVEEIPDYDLIN